MSAISVDKVPSSRFTTLPDMTNKNPYCGTDVTIERSKSNLNSETPSSNPGTSSESRLNNTRRRNGGLNEIEGAQQDQGNLSSASDSHFHDITLKFQEYRALVERNAPKEEVREILAVANFCYIMRRDHVLEIDKWLPLLRKVDRNRHGVS